MPRPTLFAPSNLYTAGFSYRNTMLMVNDQDLTRVEDGIVESYTKHKHQHVLHAVDIRCDLLHRFEPLSAEFFLDVVHKNIMAADVRRSGIAVGGNV